MRRRGLATGVALAVTGLAACGGGAGSPDEATLTFFTALSENNAKEACKLVSPARAKAAVFNPLLRGESPSTAGNRSCDEIVKGFSSDRRKEFEAVKAIPAPGTGGKVVTAQLGDEEGNTIATYSVSLIKDSEDWRLLAINAGGAP